MWTKFQWQSEPPRTSLRLRLDHVPRVLSVLLLQPQLQQLFRSLAVPHPQLLLLVLTLLQLLSESLALLRLQALLMLQQVLHLL